MFPPHFFGRFAGFVPFIAQTLRVDSLALKPTSTSQVGVSFVSCRASPLLLPAPLRQNFAKFPRQRLTVATPQVPDEAGTFELDSVAGDDRHGDRCLVRSLAKKIQTQLGLLAFHFE